MGQRIHLDILLDTMIMMLLEHYVSSFHKWLAMLKSLNLISQCLLRLEDKKFLKKCD